MSQSHLHGDTPEAFARKVLAMPEAVAIGFLRAWHASDCECGHDEGQLLYTSMKSHWAGRL